MCLRDFMLTGEMARTYTHPHNLSSFLNWVEPPLPQCTSWK